MRSQRDKVLHPLHVKSFFFSSCHQLSALSLLGDEMFVWLFIPVGSKISNKLGRRAATWILWAGLLMNGESPDLGFCVS